ncbi:MAG: metallophosphoesterase [Candidatus Zixiibacteriota bacterium]
MRSTRIILIIFLLYCFAIIAHADDTDTSSIMIDYTDGPHIFWKNDSAALVFYLCENIIDSQTFINPDTIRFDGFCRDTNLEYEIPVGRHHIEPDSFINVSKIIAVSDIHGEYEYLVDILQKAGVIDKNQNWIYGDGHLVIDGDIFDRGDMVTESLWLVYRLEIQAERNGGAVHFILGNHELMIMQNDNRYINEKYLRGIVRQSRIDHLDLYGPDMELGRWLKTKPTAVKINDILFVHGGLAPEIIAGDWDIHKLNNAVRVKLNLRSSQIAFDSTARMLFGSNGPFWYRGYHYEMENRYAQISMAGVDTLLAFYKVNTIVVGHSEVDKISGLYDNKIIAIDIPFDELNGLQALLWEKGKYYLINPNGSKEPIK